MVWQVDRCTILGEIIQHIKELEKKVQVLVNVKAKLIKNEEKEEEEREQWWLCKSSTSNNWLVNSMQNKEVSTLVGATTFGCYFWGHEDIFITLNCPKHCGIWPNLLALLQDTLELDVQNVSLSATPYFYTHSIFAKVMSSLPVLLSTSTLSPNFPLHTHEPFRCCNSSFN